MDFKKDYVWQLRQNLLSQEIDTSYIICCNHLHKFRGYHWCAGHLGARDTEVLS